VAGVQIRAYEPLLREHAHGRLLDLGCGAVPFFCGLHEEPHDYWRYTEHALRRLCEEAGLDVVSLEPYGGLPEVFCDLLAKSVVFSRIVAGALFRLSRALTALHSVQRISRRSARTFPLGYCLVAAQPIGAAGVSRCPIRSAVSLARS
jgi:hypothetical protein